MTIARMIALLVGFALVYTLQFLVGWPWYYAIPVAAAGYVGVRYLGETMMSRRPSA